MHPTGMGPEAMDLLGGEPLLHEGDGLLRDVGNVLGGEDHEAGGSTDVEDEVVPVPRGNLANDVVGRLLGRRGGISDLLEARVLTGLDRHGERLEEFLLLGGQAVRRLLRDERLALREEFLQFGVEGGTQVGNVGLGGVRGDQHLRVDEREAEPVGLRHGKRDRGSDEQGKESSNWGSHDGVTVPPAAPEAPWEC